MFTPRPPAQHVGHVSRPDQRSSRLSLLVWFPSSRTHSSFSHWPLRVAVRWCAWAAGGSVLLPRSTQAAETTHGLWLRCSFLTPLEAGKSRIKMLADLVPGGAVFLVCRWLSCVFSYGRSGGQGGDRLSHVPYRGSNSMVRAPPTLRTSSPLENPASKYHHIGY